MSEPDWNTMNPEQKLETLYQLFHALFIEAGELETRVSRFTSAMDVPPIEAEREHVQEKWIPVFLTDML